MSGLLKSAGVVFLVFAIGALLIMSILAEVGFRWGSVC